MKLFRSKKALAIGVAAAMTVGIAGGAFAYFTSTGSGNGAASVGTSTDWAVTTDPAAGGPLLPGSGTETIAYHVKNNSAANQSLVNVAISVADSTGAAWTSVAGCSKDDFTINAAAAGVTANDTSLAGVIAPGVTVDGSITLKMIESNGNQDGCKLAAVPVHLAVS